jgi:anaerobic ribonucleoside-triphosphate reductase
MNYIKVKENKNLVRHVSSNAIVNIDNIDYIKYIEERDRIKNNLTKYENLEKQIVDLKDDIDEIKTLLRGLKNGSN